MGSPPHNSSSTSNPSACLLNYINDYRKHRYVLQYGTQATDDKLEKVNVQISWIDGTNTVKVICVEPHVNFSIRYLTLQEYFRVVECFNVINKEIEPSMIEFMTSPSFLSVENHTHPCYPQIAKEVICQKITSLQHSKSIAATNVVNNATQAANAGNRNEIISSDEQLQSMMSSFSNISIHSELTQEDTDCIVECSLKSSEKLPGIISSICKNTAMNTENNNENTNNNNNVNTNNITTHNNDNTNSNTSTTNTRTKTGTKLSSSRLPADIDLPVSKLKLIYRTGENLGLHKLPAEEKRLISTMNTSEQVTAYLTPILATVDTIKPICNLSRKQGGLCEIGVLECFYSWELTYKQTLMNYYKYNETAIIAGDGFNQHTNESNLLTVIDYVPLLTSILKLFHCYADNSQINERFALIMKVLELRSIFMTHAQVKVRETACEMVTKFLIEFAGKTKFTCREYVPWTKGLASCDVEHAVMTCSTFYYYYYIIGFLDLKLKHFGITVSDPDSTIWKIPDIVKVINESNVDLQEFTQFVKRCELTSELEVKYFIFI